MSMSCVKVLNHILSPCNTISLPWIIALLLLKCFIRSPCTPFFVVSISYWDFFFYHSLSCYLEFMSLFWVLVALAIILLILNANKSNVSEPAHTHNLITQIGRTTWTIQVSYHRKSVGIGTVTWRRKNSSHPFHWSSKEMGRYLQVVLTHAVCGTMQCQHHKQFAIWIISDGDNQ